MNFPFQIGGSRAMMEIGAWMRSVAAREARMGRQQALLLGLILTLAPQASAGLIGYYSPDNWTLTNSADIQGSYKVSADGLSVVLTGGNFGTGIQDGTTDFVIQAIGTGQVQFAFSYFSFDVPAMPDIPGCGLDLKGPCDLAVFLLNGIPTWLADDVNQASGSKVFDVTTGDIFGFRVETMDNQGEPGILTISDFSAPVPEPGTTSLILMAAAVMVAARVRARP